jgi:membrane protein required for colicin V production
MNVADALILLVIAVSALLSLRRGFTREAFSLLTWVAAFVVARLFGPAFELMLEGSIETPSARMATAFAVLFAATLVFGAVRGVVLVIVLVAVGGHLFSADSWWRESVLVPHFVLLEDWTRTVAAELVKFIIRIGSA